MEEVIAFVIQFILEVGLQLFGGLGFDWGTSSRRDSRGTTEEAGCGWLSVMGIVGAACGGLSLLIRPNALLPHSWMRIANLIVAPLIAGGLSYLAAKHVWTDRGDAPAQHFWRGFWFAMCFGLVRFAYIHR